MGFAIIHNAVFNVNIDYTGNNGYMRVCWNRQTGTFEGRVSLTYGFKSRHSHQFECS